MRIADGLPLYGAQPEALRGVVGRLLQAPVVEHQRLGLAVFEKQLAVVGPFEAALEQRLGAVLVQAGASHQAEGGVGHESLVRDKSPIYTRGRGITADFPSKIAINSHPPTLRSSAY